MIQLIPIEKIKIIKTGDDIVKIILDALDEQEVKLQENDIIIIAQTIISKAEGRIIELNEVKPSKFAEILSKKLDKDPRVIELILRESISIVKTGNGKIITESRLGFVCASSGVDHSNSPTGTVTLLPLDPDKSANQIKNGIKEIKKVNIAVIITDTHGRPFREGAINVAIGVAGIEPILDYRGKKDIFNNLLQTTRVAIADELASAAELLMGESNEKIPAVIIRGYDFKTSFDSNLSKKLIRDVKNDLFR